MCSVPVRMRDIVRDESSGLTLRDRPLRGAEYRIAMYEGRGTRTNDPYALPRESVVRRMAISTLAYRAVARKREVQINDVLGEDAANLLSDLMATVANETSSQLMLTEHLLQAGWSWERILAAVWYNEEFLRTAANKE